MFKNALFILVIYCILWTFSIRSCLLSLMEQGTIKFSVNELTQEVTVDGYPELSGRKGICGGDGMAFFFGKGWGNQEVIVANMTTGKIRKISTEQGILLVDDKDINFDLIEYKCKNGYLNAKNKRVKYSGVNRWDGFKNGLCAISWMLYPEGRYFEDSDGFGGEDNDEEVVYAIMNTDLEFVIPFRPFQDIKSDLELYRQIGFLR